MGEYQHCLLRDKDGKPDYFITSTNDITEQKLAEESLFQSEERYRSLFQRNYSVMLIINPTDGKIMDANPAACEFYGWSYPEMCGKNISDINILPKSEILKKMTMSTQEGKKYFSFKHKKANGTISDVEVYSTVINNADIVSLFVIIHDITERKRAEEALRVSEEKLSTLFGSMKEMVAIHELVFDESGKATDYRIIDCNKAFTDITGISKENAIEKLATDVYKSEAAPYLDIYAKVAISGKSTEFSTSYAPMGKTLSGIRCITP